MIAPFRRKFIQAPEIFSSFSSKEVEEGEAVELKCFISCAPQTISVWENDNIPLVSSPGLSLTEKTGVRTLIIQSAKLGDAGVYRLTISNSSGSGSCSAIVTVRSMSTLSFCVSRYLIFFLFRKEHRQNSILCFQSTFNT